MKLVERDIGEWLARKIDEPIVPPYVSFAIEDEFYTVRGAVLLNDWNGSNMEITLYAPGCVSRGLISQVYEYVFRQCRATRLSARTKSPEMIKLLPRLGFEKEGTLKNYYGQGKDAEMFRLDPQKAERWMT